MESYNAIEVKDVTKKFKIYHDKGKMLKERAISWKRNQYEERWVLNGISFQVKKGEAIGLIGHNGCGKSTTLKLLTRIMYPTSGTIEMRGRVSSLLELGAGFHPDLSGRENIYINASIFGLTKKEIDKRLQNIIEFSELEDFIDNPVRTYSSGMYMRLAFSVAINVDAEILLIDEILAVGDVNFQAKCFNKLMEIKKKGTTIVLVSHSTDQIEQVCERSIWIHEGVIRADGTPREVHRQYLSFMGEHRDSSMKLKKQQEEVVEDVNITECEPVQEEQANVQDNEQTSHHRGTGEIRIEKVTALNAKKEVKKVFQTGESITFRIKYKVNERVEKALIGLSIFRQDGVRVYGSNTQADGLEYFDLSEDGIMDVYFENLMLLQDKYYLDVCIARSYEDMVDYLDTTCEFETYNIVNEMGMIRLQHQWLHNVQ